MPSICFSPKFSHLKSVKSLPNSNILAWSKFKAFADNKIIVTEKNEICSGKGRKHCGKRRKGWLPAFFPPHFQMATFSGSLKFCLDCVVKS